MADVLLVVVPKIAAGGASVLLSLFVVQFLSPASFGLYSYAVFLIQMADGTFSSAIDLAVIQRVSLTKLESQPSPVELAGLTLKSGFAIVFLIAALVLGRPLGQLLLSTPDAGPILMGAAVGAGGILLFRSLQTYFQIRQRFSTYGLYDLTQTLLRTGLVALALASGAREAVPLLSAFAVAPWLTGAAIWALSFRPRWNKRDITEALRQLAPQTYHTIRTYGIGALVSRLDLLAVGWLLSPADVGMYGLCATLLLAPELIASSLSNVFAPKIPAAVREGRIKSLFHSFHAPLFVLCAIVSVAGPWLIPAMGGWALPASYQNSLKLMAILLPGALANALLFPIALNYLMMRSPTAFFYWDLSAALVLMGMYWVAGTNWGISGIAFAASAHRVLKATFLFLRSYKLLQYDR